MVNNPRLRIVAEDECEIVPTPDANGGLRDKIVNGPVYDLSEAKIEASARKIRYVTPDALDNKLNLDLGPANLRPFINALTRLHERGSERCDTSPACTPPMSWVVDCDAYAMRWNVFYQKEFGDADEYYLKFGFKEDKSDEFLVISLHE